MADFVHSFSFSLLFPFTQYSSVYRGTITSGATAGRPSYVEVNTGAQNEVAPMVKRRLRKLCINKGNYWVSERTGCRYRDPAPSGSCIRVECSFPVMQ